MRPLPRARGREIRAWGGPGASPMTADVPGGFGPLAIVVEDYHKTYGPTVAVAGLGFRVDPGEILGLVGPNGAGKTTTLRALAGILRPTRGRLAIDGHDLEREPV